jgi:hypothetical protein
MTIGESGFCCCWIERPRCWLSGQLETNINIDIAKGHRVPHPAVYQYITLYLKALDMSTAAAPASTFTATQRWLLHQMRPGVSRASPRFTQ